MECNIIFLTLNHHLPAKNQPSLQKETKPKAKGDSQPPSPRAPKAGAETEPSAAFQLQVAEKSQGTEPGRGSGKTAANRYFTISWDDAQGDGVARFLNEVDDV